MNHGAERPDIENRSEWVAGYFSEKELLLAYMENDSGRAQNAKRRAELDVWL